jgi:hypothetical protein
MKRKNPSLDLHGVNHKDVVDRLINHFFWQGYSESVIITGNSSEMKSIVIQWLKENEFNYFISPENLGRINVIS